MPKVLKYVEVNTRSPYTLKNYIPDLKNKVDENKLEMVKAAHNRFYEDGAKSMMEDAVARAREIINKAKTDAEKLINDAHIQKLEIEKQAFEKGYAEGFEKGKQDSLQQNKKLWEERLSQFNLLRKQLLEQNSIYLDYLEKEALKVALHAAEKILSKKIEADCACYLNLIEKALEKAGEEKDIYIRIAEQDYEKIKGLEELSNMQKGTRNINFIKDPLLSSGECIIYSDYFEIDAGIHTQVENIKSKLKEIGVIDDA